jgi:excisionase family DNA binding protein
MRHPPNDEIQRLRRQLRLQIDAAAKSLAEVLLGAADLLIEIAQQGQTAVTRQTPAENRLTPEMFTPKQAADYLGVTAETLSVWRCTRRYAIPFVKVGRKVCYRKSDLDKFLDSRTENRGHGDES